MLSLKVVAVGDNNVGKRCLLRTYVEGEFPKDDKKNLTEGYKTDIQICDKPVRLVLLDTNSGDVRLRYLTYPLTDVFLLCFSVVDSKSLDNIEEIWHPEIVRHCPETPCILVGTKCDGISTKDQHKSTHTRAEALSKRIKALKYLKCSALDGEGLNEVFSEAISAVFAPSTKNKTTEQRTRKKSGSCSIS